MPFKGSQMVAMSKSGLGLAPTLTLKVLINLRLQGKEEKEAAK